jgi:hypothetical protein
MNIVNDRALILVRTKPKQKLNQVESRREDFGRVGRETERLIMSTQRKYGSKIIGEITGD